MIHHVYKTTNMARKTGEKTHIKNPYLHEAFLCVFLMICHSVWNELRLNLPFMPFWSTSLGQHTSSLPQQDTTNISFPDMSVDKKPCSSFQDVFKSDGGFCERWRNVNEGHGNTPAVCTSCMSRINWLQSQLTFLKTTLIFARLDLLQHHSRLPLHAWAAALTIVNNVVSFQSHVANLLF